VVPVESAEMEALVVVHKVASEGGRRPKTTVSDESGSHSREKGKSFQVKDSPENNYATGKVDSLERSHFSSSYNQERRQSEEQRR